jgi:hypothetical protein
MRHPHVPDPSRTLFYMPNGPLLSALPHDHDGHPRPAAQADGDRADHAVHGLRRAAEPEVLQPRIGTAYAALIRYAGARGRGTPAATGIAGCNDAVGSGSWQSQVRGYGLMKK